MRLRRRRGFMLAEIIAALVVGAVSVMAAAAAIGFTFREGAAEEAVAAREVADAQVAQALAELRSAVEVVSISPTQIVVIVNTESATGVIPTVNGAATGAYEVAYRFAGGELMRAAGPGVSWVPASPAPPAPSTVLPPLPAPPVYAGAAPACASPCEDPETAVRAYFHVSASGVRNVTNPAACAHASLGGGGRSWDCNPGYAYPDGAVLSAGEEVHDEQNWRAWWAAEDGYAQGKATYANQYSAYLTEIDTWNATAAAAVTASALPIGAWAPPAWTPSSWQVVAQGLTSGAFTGYNTAGAPTTDASSIATIGMTVGLVPGLPAEENRMALGGTSGSAARAARPLTVPPAAPNVGDPAAVSERNDWCKAHAGSCG